MSLKSRKLKRLIGITHNYLCMFPDGSAPNLEGWSTLENAIYEPVVRFTKTNNDLLHYLAARFDLILDCVILRPEMGVILSLEVVLDSSEWLVGLVTVVDADLQGIPSS